MWRAALSATGAAGATAVGLSCSRGTTCSIADHASATETISPASVAEGVVISTSTAAATSFAAFLSCGRALSLASLPIRSAFASSAGLLGDPTTVDYASPPVPRVCREPRSPGTCQTLTRRHAPTSPGRAAGWTSWLGLPRPTRCLQGHLQAGITRRTARLVQALSCALPGHQWCAPCPLTGGRTGFPRHPDSRPL